MTDEQQRAPFIIAHITVNDGDGFELVKLLHSLNSSHTDIYHYLPACGQVEVGIEIEMFDAVYNINLINSYKSFKTSYEVIS